MAAKEVQLAVVQGADKGKKWRLAPSAFYDIGRGSDNKIVLHDKAVSKRHALIECVDGVWLIQDLGSKHGTWVNKEEVEERRALFHKDVVRVGKTHLVYGNPPAEPAE